MPKKTQTAKKPTTPTKRIALKPQKCRFCAEKVTEIDYIKLVADIDRAKKELSTSKREDAVPQLLAENGKIVPRRITGTCLNHQHMLASAIKRARIMAMLPFKND